MTPETTSKILRIVPREEAFYFFTSIGNYTGMSASSLKEFVERIGDVNIKSLEFHFCRGDFEKWIADVLQDAELAGEVRRLQRFNFTGDTLRSQLSTTASRRLKSLSTHLGSTRA